jgi:hypothetical protein
MYRLEMKEIKKLAFVNIVASAIETPFYVSFFFEVDNTVLPLLLS